MLSSAILCSPRPSPTLGSTPTPRTYRVSGELCLVDAAVEDGVHAGPGGLDRHALPHAVPSARPAGVDQEALGTVRVQLLLEQVRVPAGTYIIVRVMRVKVGVMCLGDRGGRRLMNSMFSQVAKTVTGCVYTKTRSI